jgi:peptidoglycan/LPS O-acetylase OafA/YrhL
MLFWPALAIDVICILIFAIVGRSSHGEASDLIGVLRTAWPFLVGCLVGTVVGRVWRHPTSMPSALAVWAGTIALGMALRVLSGATIQLSFVIVASLVLAAFMFGWRAGYGLIRRARARRPHPAETPTP